MQEMSMHGVCFWGILNHQSLTKGYLWRFLLLLHRPHHPTPLHLPLPRPHNRNTQANALATPGANYPLVRGQKINANFFCTKFFKTASGHGRPRRKSWTSAPKIAFSCGPGGGEKLFDPWAFGRKGQECPRKIRAKKFMFMLFFLP